MGCSTVTKISGNLRLSSATSLIAEHGTPAGISSASHSAVVWVATNPNPKPKPKPKPKPQPKPQPKPKPNDLPG